MKTLFAALLSLAGAGLAAGTSPVLINGAGASFPAPVYQSWTYSYTQSHPGIKVNYQSMGSGAGVSQIKAGTVDFAGTDNPLTEEEQRKSGLLQFPMLTGGVVVVVNLPGVGADRLKLDRAALVDIFLGKIRRWDDSRLKTLNPGLNLPALRITVVRRADASGTSFLFTDYLAKISPEWKAKVGVGSSVRWPVGIGGQKNPGVCNNVAKIRGSIGYTEYTYAKESRLATAVLENRAGKFVTPSAATFSASSANADWKHTPGFYLVLTDQPGDDSWPITGVTYLLIRRDLSAGRRARLVDYFNWCFSEGAAAAAKLHYVPLPESVVKQIQSEVLK